MKLLRILLLTAFVLGAITEASLAQEKKREFAVTTGYATKLVNSLESPSKGFHLGINMYKRNAARFTSDTQLSMSYTSGTESSTNFLTINGLYGFRYYFSEPESTTRIFVNALVGLAFINEAGDDFIDNRPDVGYSGGVYVESKKMIFGISVDTPKNLIFKVGFTF